ncbi:MAG: hypothetical protein AB1656_09275 [Candidatus Omnitrophota bacterium]
MEKKNELRISFLMLIGIAAMLILLTIALATQTFSLTIQQGETQKFIEQKPAELTALVKEQQAALIGYRWIDKEKKIAAIPIERAMELVVIDSQAK